MIRGLKGGPKWGPYGGRKGVFRPYSWRYLFRPLIKGSPLETTIPYQRDDPINTLINRSFVERDIGVYIATPFRTPFRTPFWRGNGVIPVALNSLPIQRPLRTRGKGCGEVSLPSHAVRKEGW